MKTINVIKYILFAKWACLRLFLCELEGVRSTAPVDAPESIPEAILS